MPVLPSQVDSSVELVRRALRGERGASEELVRGHEKGLWLFLWRMTGSRERSEELFQEVWLAAWKGLAKFRGEASFSTWLLQIALHATRRPVRREPLRLVPAGGEAPDPAEIAERKEAGQQVERALEGLPAREREALVLHHLHGLPFAEVAHLMGVAEATARKAAWEGLRRARENNDTPSSARTAAR